MRRRELLWALALVLGDVRASAPAELAPRSPGNARQGADPPAPSAETRPLSDAESETLLAFAELLVGDRPLSPPERSELLSHIADRARASADTVARYRETAALLDRLAGLPFATLGMRERFDLVARHDVAPSRARVRHPDDAAQMVRTRVAPDLIAGYYASSMGWAVVGYGVFPGRCGDLVRYTRPEP